MNCFCLDVLLSSKGAGVNGASHGESKNPSVLGPEPNCLALLTDNPGLPVADHEVRSLSPRHTQRPKPSTNGTRASSLVALSPSESGDRSVPELLRGEQDLTDVGAGLVRVEGLEHRRRGVAVEALEDGALTERRTADHAHGVAGEVEDVVGYEGLG